MIAAQLSHRGDSLRHPHGADRNGIRFTSQARRRYAFHHIFDRVCDESGIEHRLTKLKHPWSFEEEELVQWTNSPKNGQVERMNHTIKDATVKRLHYDDPERFIIDPTHQMPGLNTSLHQATITRLRPSFLAR